MCRLSAGSNHYNMIKATEQQIQAAIEAISKRLQEPQMNQYRNAPVKEGYNEALHILRERIESYGGIKERCHSVQSRAIAVLAVDFLRGDCTHEVLCKAPIKKL